ncbi:MAG: endopeptidase La [bacterium]
MSEMDHPIAPPPSAVPPPSGEKPEPLVMPEVLPVMLLGEVIIFPNVIVPLVVTDERMVKLVNDALSGAKMIAAFARIPQPIGEGIEEQFYNVGTAVQILKMFRVPDGSVRLLVQGLARIRRLELITTEPYLTVRVEPMAVDRRRSLRIEALMRTISDEFHRVIDYSHQIPDEVKIAVYNITDPGVLGDIVTSNLNVKVEDKQEVLQTFDLEERLKKVASLVHHELKLLQLGSKIQTEVEGELEKSQRQYFLREQMKAIRRELGEEEDLGAELRELEKKVMEIGMSEEAQDIALKEISRLRNMSAASAEYTVSRTYVEWLIALPWSNSSEDRLDVEMAEEILNEDHYGLEDVKERILEFLAVRTLKKTMKGPILCFVGPPGVGKTSLGRSIARAMNRQFNRMSLGGMRDEAEIRGHRRTYIGALPGRIIQSVRRSGVNNPVLMLDEIDKLGQDFRGDPSSALLEVLDPEQNFSFQDHYLDVPFDLSRVMFSTTANDVHAIPLPLRDRMEILQLPGYISPEKVEIAKHYLVPRQLDANGLKKSHLRFRDTGLETIIAQYTREAGVRALEQQIAAICRKVARSLAKGEKTRVTVTPKNVADFLGVPRFLEDRAVKKAEVGRATGLAWTPFGGDILAIESTWMPGSKELQVTGRLGEVMKESAAIALSFLRANAAKFGVAEDIFRRRDIHIHVPEGATPKDGPSAGITLCASLASLFLNTPVRNDVALTGEITLRGRVLPIGGLREKVVAAHRAGIREIILPRQNEKDLQDVPENIRTRMNFIFVDRVEEVLKLVLLQKPNVKG